MALAKTQCPVGCKAHNHNWDGYAYTSEPTMLDPLGMGPEGTNGLLPDLLPVPTQPNLPASDIKISLYTTIGNGENPLLPVDAKERKKIPIGTGVMDYFPAALAEVAKVSFIGNEQHNPGHDLHWARGKSTDQFDTIIRHLMERGKIDIDGMRHTAKAAWRILALLQLELEAEGAPLARGARLPEAAPNLEQK